MASIKSRLILAVVAMAAILAAVAFLISGQLNTLDGDLNELHAAQDVKSHVLAPQKDMNQFLAAMESTMLWLDLGDAGEAQDAYESSVDAEQDISGEFAYLEENASADFKPVIEQAHKDWEVATEFLKIQAETAAAEHGLALARPSTDPTKTVDAHTDEGIAQAQKQYGGLDGATLAKIADDNAVSPVEAADEGIDGAEEQIDEILAGYQASGDESLARTRSLTMTALVVALLGVVLVGLLATISIVRPLDKLEAGAKAIADGDLDYEFGAISSDEVGVVTKSVEEMAHSLKARIRNLEEVAGVVVLTSEDIAKAAKAEGGVDAAEILAKAESLKAIVAPVLGGSKQS